MAQRTTDQDDYVLQLESMLWKLSGEITTQGWHALDDDQKETLADILDRVHTELDEADPDLEEDLRYHPEERWWREATVIQLRPDSPPAPAEAAA